MKNIVKTLFNVNFDDNRRSHDVILSARRAARESRVNPRAVRWQIPDGKPMPWLPR